MPGGSRGLDTKEEAMAISVTDTATGKSSFATPGGGEHEALLLLLAAQEARDTQRRAEEAAIDAEDYWTQAEEACAVEPIG